MGIYNNPDTVVNFNPNYSDINYMSRFFLLMCNPQICPAFSRPRNFGWRLLKFCPSFSSPAFSRPRNICLSFSSLSFSRPLVFFVRHFQIVHFQSPSLLTAIDVFSKRALALPLRSKTGREVADAFEKILQKQRFNMCQTDKGSEFYNAAFRSLMDKWNMRHYSSENEDLKASVVERWNRTLKGRMFRYFTAHHTRRYVDALPDIVHSYNNTRHPRWPR